MLKKAKQAFLDARPTKAEAAKEFSRLCGFTVSENAVGQIQEATGIRWEPKRATPRPSTVKNNALRTVTVSLYRLYKKLGEEVPSSLLDLYNSYSQQDEGKESS